MTTTTIPANAIFTHNSQVMTNTLKVAEAFRKNHKDILRKIDSLDCSKDFTERNFALSEYRDSTGRSLPLWEMTKDGFIFLVMGFTGKQAAQIKEAYINAFNMMADELQKVAPERLATIMGQTIGTDGFHCLGAVLDGKLRHLPVPTRKRIKQHIWSQVHKAFSVVSAQDIPAEQLDSARNFIAAYAIEGEWLGKDKSEEVFTLTREQAMELSQLLHSVDWVNHRWQQGIGKGVEALNRPLYAATVEHVSSMARSSRYLDRELVALRQHFAYLGGKRPDQRFHQLNA